MGARDANLQDEGRVEELLLSEHKLQEEVNRLRRELAQINQTGPGLQVTDDYNIRAPTRESKRMRK